MNALMSGPWIVSVHTGFESGGMVTIPAAVSAGASSQIHWCVQRSAFSNARENLERGSISMECCADYAVFDDKQTDGRAAIGGLDPEHSVVSESNISWQPIANISLSAASWA